MSKFSEFMNSSTAGNIVGTGLGLLLQGYNDKRQIRQQEKLNEQQLKFDIRKSELQKQMQLDMWKQTSFPAQMEMMKKAGLNPSLMYGGGGGGSSTIGGGMSNVSAPNAPGGSNEILGMMMQKAQLELLNAQARKTNAEADNASSVDVDLKRAQEALALSSKEVNEMDKIIKEWTGKDLASYIGWIKEPLRGIEKAAYENELSARSAIADNIYQQYLDGNLRNKSVAELENIELNNAKTREERKNIMKSFDILEENLKGIQLDNFMKEIETKWMDGTGLKGSDAKDGLLKLLGMFMSIKK